jgi:acetyl-CoA carboxylase carboxyl transferase subunit beta
MVDKNKPQQEKRGGWLSRFAPGVRKIVSRRDTPDNLWVKDPDTGEMLYRSDLEGSLWVTPSGRHMRIDAPTRLRFTFDGGEYESIDTPDVPEDPLKFSDGKSYKDRLNAARKAAGRKDTMAIGYGSVGGQDAVVIVQDFTFMGGSLGMAAGEAFIKAAREAVARQVPMVCFTAAGGARMQEGALSLMLRQLCISHGCLGSSIQLDAVASCCIQICIGRRRFITRLFKLCRGCKACLVQLLDAA